MKDLRRIVKEKFLAFKDVKDARVVDMLIFKGRERKGRRGRRGRDPLVSLVVFGCHIISLSLHI